jgi:hypothetical protein
MEVDDAKLVFRLTEDTIQFGDGFDVCDRHDGSWVGTVK